MKLLNQKTIFFLDIDGTLIQPNQKPNVSSLPSIIKKMKKEGVLFSLNSNRSLQDVVGIKKWLSLNGPIILENGVYSIQSNKKIFFSKKPFLVRSIVINLLKKFVSEKKLDCKVLVGDTVKYIKTRELNNEPLVILVNKYRLYTSSVHILKYGKHDFELAHELVIFLRKAFSQFKMDFSVECPPAFGNVVLWPKNTDKGKALRKLRKYYKGYKIYMIGDDLADLRTLPAIDGFFAVGNAHVDVKKKALYTSPYPYTKGVVDILRHYQENIKK